MLVVKIMAKNLDLALNFLMLMHCTTNKKLRVSLKIMLPWIVTRNRIRVIPCNWEQGAVQFYILWRQQNTSGRGSHCITSIPTSGTRDCKVERLATSYHHIKKKSASLQSFPSYMAMGSTQK